MSISQPAGKTAEFREDGVVQHETCALGKAR